MEVSGSVHTFPKQVVQSTFTRPDLVTADPPSRRAWRESGHGHGRCNAWGIGPFRRGGAFDESGSCWFG